MNMIVFNFSSNFIKNDLDLFYFSFYKIKKHTIVLVKKFCFFFVWDEYFIFVIIYSIF